MNEDRSFSDGLQSASFTLDLSKPSADVASRFGRRFMSLMGDTTGVHYFADSSAVVGYDLSAFPFVLDAMLAKREHFKLIVVLPWAGPVGKKAQTFADAFGCVEYVSIAGRRTRRRREFADRAARGARDGVSIE